MHVSTFTARRIPHIIASIMWNNSLVNQIENIPVTFTDRHRERGRGKESKSILDLIRIFASFPLIEYIARQKDEIKESMKIEMNIEIEEEIEEEKDWEQQLQCTLFYLFFVSLTSFIIVIIFYLFSYRYHYCIHSVKRQW